MSNMQTTSYDTFETPRIEAESLTVNIVAPCSMPPGYQLVAMFEGVSFTVQVPEGGINQGDHFTVPIYPGSTSQIRTSSFGRSRGRWRDGLCDCFRLGLCHPSLMNATCCPLILLGQVMTRMKLNWLAQPAPPTEWERTFRTLVYILIAVIVFNLLFGPPPPIQTPDGYVNMIETRPWSIVALSHIVNVGFSAYCLLLTWRLRSFVRFKYGIPEVRCLGCEDLCCSFWCGCCTLAQIARQTIDYDLEPAACCTTDGLIPMESRHAITI